MIGKETFEMKLIIELGNYMNSNPIILILLFPEVSSLHIALRITLNLPFPAVTL